MKKIFFIHIAKTAGSSFNTFLKRYFNGKDHCEEHFAVGSDLFFDSSYVEWLKSLDYISGHLKYDVFSSNNLSKEEYFLFTLVREPMSQFFSHLNWVMSLLDTDPKFLIMHPGINAISSELRNSNLLDPDIFISLLQRIEFKGLFQNNQSRYFSASPELVGKHFIIDRMLQLDMVGITEDYANTLKLFTSLNSLTSIEYTISSENQNSNYFISNNILQNRLLHEFILEYNSVDFEVYNYFLSRFKEILAQQEERSNSFTSSDLSAYHSPNDRTRSGRMFFDIDIASAKGLEFESLTRPIVQKSEGDVLYLDHLSTSELKLKYKDHGLELEEVVKIDPVLSFELSLKELVGRCESFDYVTASHVIEHVPNPIKWLGEIWNVLTDSGKLSLVIPDKRFCFDYLRELTTSADWITSYLNDEKKPSAKAVFDGVSNAVQHKGNNAWSQHISHFQVRKINTLDQAFELAKSVLKSEAYHDVHSWCFTPNSFFKIVHDLISLRLLNFSISYFHDTVGCEFYVTFKKEERNVEVGKLLATIPYQLSCSEVSIPRNFDCQRYLELNPDVADAGVDPIQHFIRFGKNENRRYI
jgi:SAM-dependent methyltransferase